MEHLDSGCGLNATARLVGVSKDAVGRLLRVGAGSAINCMIGWFATCSRRPSSLMRNVVCGKKTTARDRPRRPESNRDYWDANSLDPQSKLLVSLVPGHRTTRTIHQVVADAAQRLASDAGLAGAVTDGEPTYPEAIVTTFGRAYPVPRRSPAADARPRWCGSPKAWYMPKWSNIGKGGGSNRWKSDRFWQGQIGPSRGRLGLDEANTSAIERFKPDRSDAQRTKGAQNLRFSRRTDRHDALSWIGAVRYNFIIRIGPCDSEPNKGDGNRGVRRWPPVSPIISILRWNSCDFVRWGLR